jgi:hypothetical protein
MKHISIDLYIYITLHIVRHRLINSEGKSDDGFNQINT